MAKPLIRVASGSDRTWTSDLITGLGGEMEVSRLFTNAKDGSKRFSLVLARTRPGGTHGWHSRPEDEAIYVLSGECTLSHYDADNMVHQVVLHEGDAVLIPAGVKHQNQNTGKFENSIIGIHAPAPI